MNPTSNITNLLGFNIHRGAELDEPEPLTAEEKQAIADEHKAEQIKWHRANARTGPFQLNHTSYGRAVSRARRSEVAAKRKMNRKRRKAWLDSRHETAVLRGHLQAVGEIPGSKGQILHPGLEASAAIFTSLIVKYGERDDTGALIESDDLLEDSIAAAKADYVARVSA